MRGIYARDDQETSSQVFNWLSLVILFLRICVFALPTAIVAFLTLQEAQYELTIAFGVSQLGMLMLRFGLDAPLQRISFLQKLFGERSFGCRLLILLRFLRAPLSIFFALAVLVLFLDITETVEGALAGSLMGASLLNSFAHHIAVLFLGLKKKFIFLVCSGSLYYIFVLLLFLLKLDDAVLLFPAAATINFFIAFYIFYRMRNADFTELELQEASSPAPKERLLFAGINAVIVGGIGWGCGWYFSIISSAEDGAVALAGLKIAQICSLPMLLIQQMFSPELRNQLDSLGNFHEWLQRYRMICLVSGSFILGLLWLSDLTLGVFDLQSSIVYLGIIFVLGNVAVFSQTLLSFVGRHDLILLGSLISALLFFTSSFFFSKANIDLIYSLALYSLTSFVLYFYFARAYYIDTK